MVLARVPLKEAPFNFAVAVEASGIELPESDPGDVFLAATASVSRLTFGDRRRAVRRALLVEDDG